MSSIYENNILVFSLPVALLLRSSDLQALALKAVKRKRKKPLAEFRTVTNIRSWFNQKQSVIKGTHDTN